MGELPIVSLATTILRPVAHVAGRHARRQVRAFQAACQDTRQSQLALMHRLLRHFADTDFGRDHGLGSIDSYEALTEAVPVRSYEQLRPWADRVFAGQTTALLPPGEPVLMFSQTSGTTGRPKNIPVTPRVLTEMRLGWNVFGLRALDDHPDAWLRSILQISSPMDESTSPTGVPCGAISGLLATTQKRIVRRMYAAPHSVARIADPVAKAYTLLRVSAGRDVAMITTANPSSTIKLIDTGAAQVERLCRDAADGTFTPPGEVPADVRRTLRIRRDRRLARRLEKGLAEDGRFLPRHVWNVALLCNWTGGTLGLYLDRLRELFDGAAIRDIGLLASEGRLSIPFADDSAAGAADVVGNLLEFIPAGARDEVNPPTVPAWDVEVGAEYFLVLTNWTGLWRYNLDDRVRIVDRFGDAPVIEFLCRGRHTASITGEKITEHQVVEAMDLARRRTGSSVERFVVQGRFADTPYYELRLESADGDDLQRVADALDAALGELNVEYLGKRRSGRLGPIRPVALPPGTLESAEREQIALRKGRAEQYKHTYLLTEVLRDP